MNPDNIKKYISCDQQDCFENNFFKDSLSKKSCAHVFYRNLPIEQHAHVIYPFINLIKEIKPTRIIEIGTFAGGLTLMLRDVLNECGLLDSNIITYDVRNQDNLKIIIDDNQLMNIDINNINLFSDNYNNLKIDSIKDLIQSNGRTILICDGGCKKCEFNILSKYLKKDDIIMAHDYAPDIEYFEEHMKDRVWNWCEIQYSDIDEVCKKYNLEPYMKEDFLNVAWGCFIKKY